MFLDELYLGKNIGVNELLKDFNEEWLKKNVSEGAALAYPGSNNDNQQM